MKFERFTFEGNVLDTVDKYDEYKVSISDNKELRDRFDTAVKLYVYDSIEQIAACRKANPNESPFALGDDNDWDFSDYLYNILDDSEFIYEEEFDAETTEYDLEDGWANIFKIFRHPTTGQLYGLPTTYSPWNGWDWCVDDFFYATQEQKTITTYHLEFGGEE